jgi:guanylate kinase
LTAEQRKAALEKAAQVRRERAAVKTRIKNSEASVRQIISEGQDNEIIGKMRVLDVLQAIPGLGKVRARNLMERLGSPSRGASAGSASIRSPPSSASLNTAADSAAAPRPRLTVLAGPTAVGKGSVAAAIREHHPEVWISVSVTTRPPRPGEVDGVHYWFVDDARFDAMIAGGELLEWAVVHGAARYGTPRAPVEEALERGDLALLEIDLQGARQVRETMPAAMFVFLKPPSWEELVRRLVGRGTETEAERARRLETAVEELAAEPEFDATLVNVEVREAAAELVRLMRSSSGSLPSSTSADSPHHLR